MFQAIVDYSGEFMFQAIVDYSGEFMFQALFCERYQSARQLSLQEQVIPEEKGNKLCKLLPFS